MNETLITSPKGTYIKIASGWLATMFLCIFISLVLSILLKELPVSRNLFLSIVWISLPLLWLVGSIKAYLSYKKGLYILHEDSLIIQKGGMFGVASKMYRYDSIVSVEVKQKYFGKKNNYGTILITIPRLEKIVKLDDVIDPRTQAARLKNATTKRSQTQSHIV